ncbi:uncharacterized protein M6B38_127595 [Iris pallida]|uniref:Homeodomain-like superfamily protein n=1 Tax=Iris pallida TaxID=29817 RepID=A0AAX6G4M9_IRIPA|nr:uncharacterized protein M6B38_127595 [Iris pallida]
MSLPMANQNEENGHDRQSLAASHAEIPMGNDVNLEVEEEDEEDEDMDFNPFLRGDVPSEASSSLSSEDEGINDIAERSIYGSSNDKNAGPSSIPMNETQCPKEDYEIGDLSENRDADCLTRENSLQKPMIEADTEDAICRRTRARHSLANYTLEELETFLQESDDECDIPNVDDEEEYRKFLAAVLLEGADEVQSGLQEGNVDEDEEDDADFELEIEEALESDIDEYVGCNGRMVDKAGKGSHMPETRHKKRLKESSKDKKNQLGPVLTPLRPILPYEPNAKIAPLPSYGWQFLLPKSASSSGAGVINGFTAHQLGQLYCLIHEHVQLLIQIFSISVLDPSRQHVANGVRKMILEMNDRREEAISQRKFSYPEYCFHPPNISSSLQFESHQNADSSYWAPFVDSKSVQSILDVAPLRLVMSYMTDVSEAVLRHRQRYIQEVPDEDLLTKEPLFPLPALPSPADTTDDVSGGTTVPILSSLSPGQVQPKKSLAATLVETTKKQSVALVPKDIAKSAQRFCPLFNSALFPHKPPLPALANRVLFTDAEDRLLAMGLMNYNNDWAAIQHHYLPCKSKHQIFVRQKNRSSSKAPENPIKAVRRMKTSPLTEHEQARICEGLQLFKEDWSSVWRFCVPHRDPTLLPRQWRIANGTQKSYKKSQADKEKRRLSEAKRRKLKASAAENKNSLEKEINNGDKSADDVDGEDDEAYVHEAFLEDSERGSSKVPYDNLSSLNTGETRAIDIMSYKGSYINEHGDSVTNEFGQSRQGNGHELLNSSLQDMQPPSHLSHIKFSKVSNPIAKLSNCPPVQRPYQICSSKGARVVKLAPDLPPVNLPSSVRVISQSAFKCYNSKSFCPQIPANAIKDHVPEPPQVSKVGTSMSTPGEYLNKYSDTRCQRVEGILASSFGEEENTSESDLRMHPLLFQASEVQSSLCFLDNRHTTSSSTYNFFPGHPFQADSSLRYHPVKPIDGTTRQSEEAPSSLCTIDFHPLLQRESATVPSICRQYLRMPQGRSDKLYNQSDNNLTAPVVGNSHVTASTSSVRLYEKENNLDLNIRLSSTPEKEIAEGRDMNERQVGVSISPLGHRIVKSGLDADRPFVNRSGNRPPSLVTNDSPVQSFTCSPNDALSSEVLPGNSGACQHMIDLHDESVRGIVMEQEELSDSEEEIEDVEFEREEIDDSEEDELCCEQPTEIQNKELPFVTSRKESLKSNDNLNLGPPYSRFPKEGSMRKVGDGTSPMQISQDPCQAKSSRLKPQSSNAKQNRACRSSTDVLAGRSSKKQSVESSKRQSLKTAQCKAVSSSKRSRKHSV